MYNGSKTESTLDRAKFALQCIFNFNKPRKKNCSLITVITAVNNNNSKITNR